MSDIGIIVNCLNMYSMAQEVVNRIEGDVEITLAHTYEISLDIARDMTNKGTRILISRGGHSAWLREHGVNVPIIDIPFTGITIASLLIQAKAEYGRFGVIGNNQLVGISKELEQAIGGEIVYFPIKMWKDFENQIMLAKNSGIKAIVGGYDACSFAKVAELDCYCVTSSSYEIESAFMEAIKTLSFFDQEKYWSQMFKTVMKSVNDGIIILNKDGLVEHINQRAKKLLTIDGETISKSPIFISGLQPENYIDTLKNSTQYRDIFLKDYGCEMKISPIKAYNKILGFVVVLQEIEYEKNVEYETHEKSQQTKISIEPTITTIITKKQYEQELTLRALSESNGNKTKAAQALGISRPTLYRRLNEMELLANES